MNDEEKPEELPSQSSLEEEDDPFATHDMEPPPEIKKLRDLRNASVVRNDPETG